MAEYSKVETKTVAEIFAEAYNKLNSSDYSWNNEKSYQPGEPYDFKLYESKKELGVQLVRAVADADREFIRPNRVQAVIDSLKKSLDEKGLPPLSIYMNFVHPPENDDELDEIIFYLELYIEHKSDSSRTGYFMYHASFDDQFLPKIRKYINNFEISPRVDGKKNVLLAYSSSRDYPEPWLDDQQKVSIAVQKKEKKYHDIILLVDSGTFPVDDEYISMIKDSLATSKIAEIWVVNNFASHRGAVKVK
jgi:hypothetical protein